MLRIANSEPKCRLLKSDIYKEWHILDYLFSFLMIFRSGKPIKWDEVSEKRSTVISTEKYLGKNIPYLYLNLRPWRWWNILRKHPQIDHFSLIKLCEFCELLCHWRRPVVFIVSFEHNTQLFPVFLLVTLNK